VAPGRKWNSLLDLLSLEDSGEITGVQNEQPTEMNGLRQKLGHYVQEKGEMLVKNWQGKRHVGPGEGKTKATADSSSTKKRDVLSGFSQTRMKAQTSTAGQERRRGIKGRRYVKNGGPNGGSAEMALVETRDCLMWGGGGGGGAPESEYWAQGGLGRKK